MKKYITAILLACGLAAAGPFDAGQLSFTATLNTTDNTTNVIASVLCPSNRVVRVEAQFLGIGGSYHSCSYGKFGTFRNLGGTNTIQISITATLASAETDAACDAQLVTDGTNVLVRVAGATGVPMQWLSHVNVFYSPELLAEAP